MYYNLIVFLGWSVSILARGGWGRGANPVPKLISEWSLPRSTNIRDCVESFCLYVVTRPGFQDLFGKTALDLASKNVRAEKSLSLGLQADHISQASISGSVNGKCFSSCCLLPAALPWGIQHPGAAADTQRCSWVLGPLATIYSKTGFVVRARTCVCVCVCWFGC